MIYIVSATNKKEEQAFVASTFATIWKSCSLTLAKMKLRFDDNAVGTIVFLFIIGTSL